MSNPPLNTERVNFEGGTYCIYQRYLPCPGCLGYHLEVSSYWYYGELMLEAYCLDCQWHLKGLDPTRGLEEQVK